MNLFATVLTNIAPSANYRGESLENVAAMQKITIGRFEYPIISPEAMRNAIREILRGYPDVECNRERLGDEEQLAVKFADFPDAEKYADDFLMGWLVAAKKDERRKYKEELILKGRGGEGESRKLKELRKCCLDAKKKADAANADDTKKKAQSEEKEARDNINRIVDGWQGFQFKRDSVLRMNLAVALEPFRHSTVFTQSPQQLDSPWQNAEQSQLLHRETAVTAFQYPLAINLQDCKTEKQKEWTKCLLRAIGELSSVAGNHARSYFEMAPASIVVRLTEQLVAGYDTYGFEIQDSGAGGIGKGVHRLTEIVDGVTREPADYCGKEFYLGGKVVRDLSENEHSALAEAGVTLDRSPQRLLETIAGEMFGEKKKD